MSPDRFPELGPSACREVFINPITTNTAAELAEIALALDPEEVILVTDGHNQFKLTTTEFKSVLLHDVVRATLEEAEAYPGFTWMPSDTGLPGSMEMAIHQINAAGLADTPFQEAA
jgi:hypothetical protein